MTLTISSCGIVRVSRFGMNVVMSKLKSMLQNNFKKINISNGSFHNLACLEFLPKSEDHSDRPISSTSKALKLSHTAQQWL